MLKTRIPPLVHLALCIGLTYLFARYFPIIRFNFPFQPALALFISLFGVVILGVSAVRFVINKTTVNPHVPSQTNKLVVGGLYRYSRNPMYLGMAAILMGVIVYFGALSSLCSLVLFIALINVLQILPEEEALAELFGEDYAHYRAKVRRWV